MNELKLNSLIYFYDTFFNNIVLFGRYLHIKRYRLNTCLVTINQFELTPALSSKINVTVNHFNIVEPLFCVLQLDQYF